MSAMTTSPDPSVAPILVHRGTSPSRVQRSPIPVGASWRRYFAAAEEERTEDERVAIVWGHSLTTSALSRGCDADVPEALRDRLRVRSARVRQDAEYRSWRQSRPFLEAVANDASDPESSRSAAEILEVLEELDARSLT